MLGTLLFFLSVFLFFLSARHFAFPFIGCFPYIRPAVIFELLSSSPQSSVNDEGNSIDEDSFFELLTRFQSKRMDDQRCTLVGEEADSAPIVPPHIIDNDDGAPMVNGERFISLS